MLTTKHSISILIKLALLIAITSRLYADEKLWDLRKIAVDAKASSEEGGNPAVKAFDGDKGTRWSSEFSDDQWIYLDLGEITEITEITLLWETAFAQEYKIEVSDDAADWKTVKHIENNKGGENNLSFQNLHSRYIRMTGIKRATQWGSSLIEFIVKGPHTGIEPEHGGLIRPKTNITIYDKNYKELSKYFTEQISNDPPDSKNLTDDQFLDLIEKRAFDYFWYEVHPKSLYVVDSTTWKTHTSIAGIGMQIAAYIIGHKRNYKDPDEIYKRVEALLDNCYDDPSDTNDLCLDHHSGWPYHWVNIETGIWEGHEHICTHDSIMYLCGVIAAKYYFKGTRAGRIAEKIIDSTDWSWIIHKGKFKRFISNCYARTYSDRSGCEIRFYDAMKFDLLLPIGGIRENISPEYWHNFAQDYPWDDYKGHFRRIERPALWIHQWDNIWFDFKYLKDDYTDYYQNSVEATLANRQWSLDQGWYDENLWGINPCLGPDGHGGCFYKDYGAPPDKLPFQKGTDNDYTIATTAAIPCIVFTPEESIKVARCMYDNYKNSVWGRYGFTDALNPEKNWFCKEYIGIDVGPIIMNAENYRTGLIYKNFEKEPMVWNGLKRAGFVKIIDNFDESEHSVPYAKWESKDLKIEKIQKFVREGTHSLEVEYNGKSKNQFFVFPGLKDFTGFRYLSMWILDGNDFLPEVTICPEDGKCLVPKIIKINDGYGSWKHIYMELPAGGYTVPVRNIMFEIYTAKTGKMYLDDIVLTDTLREEEPDVLIADFEKDAKVSMAMDINSNAVYSEEKPHTGKKSLKVSFDEKKPSKITFSFDEPQDWRKFHSISMWVYGNTLITLKLKDSFGKAYIVDTKKGSKGEWTKLFYNIQATLNPKNCWEMRYDKKFIKELQIHFKDPSAVYIDDVVLTE
ncbi:MAG: discoidin domain-containing protein [Elusimicrobia bacterium]|nr:discoidin domain-containing protein [Elusimicrobiota bacterium]